MWHAIGQALPQAAGIALSPLPIALLLLMLVSARGRTNGPAFAVGWTVSVVGMIVIAFLVADGIDVSGDQQDRGHVIHLLLGAVFVALAVTQWRSRPRPGQDPPRPKLFDAVDRTTPLRALGLAVAGDRSRATLHTTKSWLLANNPTIMFVLFTVLGAKMLGSGLGILD